MDGLRDFGPYVPAYGDDGCVAFTAGMEDGSACVWRMRGGKLARLWQSDREELQAASHPDINSAGEWCVYAERADGSRMLVVSHDDAAHDTKIAAGLLGPTMNESGVIAMRGEDSILRVVDGQAEVLAKIGSEYAAFHGIPVVNAGGDVAFRVDTTDGRSVIAVAMAGTGRVELAYASRSSAVLGNFPCMNDAGAIVFACTDEHGTSRLHCAHDGRVETLLEDRGRFASIRGGVHGDDGVVYFFATEHGGGLGLYAGRRAGLDARLAQPECLLAVGGAFFGSMVREFALNSASIGARDGIAVRVGLADGRGVIVERESRTSASRRGCTG
jgi:hypothetical protein